MFVTENISALFKKGVLKIEATEDGYKRYAEATVVIDPFTPALARELGEGIAEHLFTDDDDIREELDAIDLRVRVGTQNVTVRRHEDLEPQAILAPVSIQDVSVKRCQKKDMADWLACSFVLVFSLEDREARAFVLDDFGKFLRWTFQAQQRDLLDQAEMHEAAARLGEIGGPVEIRGPDGEVVRFDDDTAVRHRGAAKALRRQAARQQRAH